jgi:hypothetical protein
LSFTTSLELFIIAWYLCSVWKTGTFFLIMDKMLRWQEVISIWLSKNIYCSFYSLYKILGLFFPLMSQCCV